MELVTVFANFYDQLMADSHSEQVTVCVNSYFFVLDGYYNEQESYCDPKLAMEQAGVPV